MELYEIIMIIFGLCVESFVICINKGRNNSFKIKEILLISLLFSLSHVVFSFLGYFCCSVFSDIITNFKEYIGILILFILGFNMITEGFSKDCFDDETSFKIRNILPMCIFCGINAFAFGIGYSCFDNVLNYLLTFLDFGIITFVSCYFAFKFSKKIFNKFENRALIIAGSVLVFIGVKTLIFSVDYGLRFIK